MLQSEIHFLLIVIFIWVSCGWAEVEKCLSIYIWFCHLCKYIFNDVLMFYDWGVAANGYSSAFSK